MLQLISNPRKSNIDHKGHVMSTLDGSTGEGSIDTGPFSANELQEDSLFE